VSKYKNHEQSLLKWNDDGTCLSRVELTTIPCVCGIQPCRGGLRTTSGTYRPHTPSRPRSAYKAAVKAGLFNPLSPQPLGEWRRYRRPDIKFWNNFVSLAPCSTVLIPAAKFVRLFWSKHPRTHCSSTGIREPTHSVEVPEYDQDQGTHRSGPCVGHYGTESGRISVVSAATDETLRFWDIFGSPSVSVAIRRNV
jgi:hypothetical protein